MTVSWVKTKDKQFGEDVRKIYEDLGYYVIDVPMTDPAARAEFIIQTIMKNKVIHAPTPGTTLPDCLPILKEIKHLIASFVLCLVTQSYSHGL